MFIGVTVQDLIHMGFMFIKRAELDGRLKPLEEVKRPQREWFVPWLCVVLMKDMWESTIKATSYTSF